AGCATGRHSESLPPFSELGPGATAAQATLATITNRLTEDLLRPGQNFFTLGPGDRLEIEILGNPNSRVLTPVGPDGKIYYQLLPGLDVWGLTLGQTRELVEQQ